MSGVTWLNLRVVDVGGGISQLSELILPSSQLWGRDILTVEDQGRRRCIQLFTRASFQSQEIRTSMKMMLTSAHLIKS